jgi:hypothetical protein
MADLVGRTMADQGDEDDLREEIMQMVPEHGRFLLNQVNQDDDGGLPANGADAVVPPIALPLPDNLLGEEWDNIIPPDLTDHPVITAFEASNANFLITNPRIAGNPIIYASEVRMTRYRKLSLYHYATNRHKTPKCSTCSSWFSF